MTARDELAARQAELVRALLAGGPVPPGFDPDRIRVEAAALHAKRRAVAERLRPDLADDLGEDFGTLFDTWAATRPRRAGVSFRADLADFASWLSSRGRRRPALRRRG
ncbi:hypothetical protein [Actinophytocola gossypii]|uniref:SCO6045-like C-terminal domain-containing protein n=1 Tax=Actinophytocola gossypii TaxID=2812003 RepID=A0ABT2JCG6_9PSEU|nr:hypothetical protein [Actinophytocola gossypii]MCT2585466.1 hypothetical protein [Actinophytocola gossypii]